MTFHVAQRRALLPRPAADPLPLPDQGARRAAPARRRAAHARVHHEGLLHVRPRRGGPRGGLRASTSRPTTGSSTAAGCDWYRVESDVGMMGGLGAHEYMAPCAAGENDVALAPGYAANVEVASADAAAGRAAAAAAGARARHTPGMTTSRRSPARSACRPGALLKAFPVVADGGGLRARARPRRPPRQRDQAAQRARRARSGPARDESASASARPASSARSARTSPILLDEGVAPAATSTGANEPDRHLRGVEPGPRLPVRARRRPHASRRATPSTARDHHRARDRGRQHLQARHALLRAARRDLPRRERQGAAV